MKIASFKRDYLTQLEKPKPKRYKGRKSDNWDNFEKRYNNMWSINERIARYNLRLQKASDKLTRDKKYKHFYKHLDAIKVMKNSNIDALFVKSIEQVKKDFINTYFDGSSIDAICDLSVINSLDWESIDFSTKESKRETFKNMLTKNPTLDAKVTEREKALDAINKQLSKQKAKENAEKVKEQAKLLQEQAQAMQELEQAKQEQAQAMQAQAILLEKLQARLLELENAKLEQVKARRQASKKTSK